jgi:uroporphyrinogen-III synthase
MTKPLSGWRVLVPRGGRWGDTVGSRLRTLGASPVVAPMINFASTAEPEELAAALRSLEEGRFDWLVVTSATTVDVLASHGTQIPAHTRVAAVGETTAAALGLAGYRADFIPVGEYSARGLVREWPVDSAKRGGRVLLPQSEIAEPTLLAGLTRLGFEVTFISAYRTVGVPVEDQVKADLAAGDIRAVLVSSGSVARQVAEQLAPLPMQTVVACIGPRTASDARAAGLPVHVIAETRSADALIDALVEYAESES